MPESPDRPSSLCKGIEALQPIAFNRLTSSCFLGVPSGLVVSHSIRPWKPTTSATAQQDRGYQINTGTNIKEA